MSRSLIAVVMLFSLVLPLYAQTPPTDTVYMPWEAYQSLRDALKEKESERSKAYSYQNAVYTGTARIDKQKYLVSFQVEIHVATYGKNEKFVPFLSSGLSFESLTVDGNQAVWTEKSGFFHVLISGEGKHIVRSSFTMVLDARRWPRLLTIPLVMIPKSEVILNVPDTDIDAKFEPGVTAAVTSLENSSKIHGHIPAVSEVSIRWLKRSEVREETPLKMSSVIHSFISLEEKGAGCESSITFQILQGETNFFRILIPESVDILDVSASDPAKPISQWFTEETTDNKSGGRMIHIYTSYRQKEKFGLKIAYERTETQSAYQFDIPHLVPVAVERNENLIAVGAGASVEIAEAGAQQIEQGDVRFLPAEISEFAKGNALFFYKALSEEFSLKFGVKTHEKAKTAQTMIERIDADSVISETGTLMTKAVYRLKNNQAQFLRLKLPEKSKLLSAFLSGKEVQPAVDKDSVLIPIEKSVDQAFPVEIAYLTETKRFGIFGSHTVNLPENELPAGELEWTLYTPHNYQIIRFSGNIEQRKSGMRAMILGYSDWEMNLAYAGEGSGWNSNKSSDNIGIYSDKGLKKRFKTSQSEAEYQEQKFKSAQIQVQIPITGNQTRFGSYLIKGFTPQITFWHIDDMLRKLTALFVCSAIFLFILWTLAIVFTRPAIPESLRNLRLYLAGFGIFICIAILPMILSLGIFNYLKDCISLAIIGFTIFQNAYVRETHKTDKPRIRLIVSAVPMIVLILMWFGGAQWLAITLCIASIIAHAVYEKVKMKRRMAIVVIVISAICWNAAMPNANADTDVPKPSADSVNSSNAVQAQHTRVIVPLKDVLDMLDKIEQKKKARQGKPDQGYVFGTVRITGNVSETRAALKIEAPMMILSDEFVRIPLLNAAVPIIDARFDGKPIALNREKDKVFFETRKTDQGIGMLELTVITPVKEKGGVNEFILDSDMIRGGQIEIGFDEAVKSMTLYGTAWQETEGLKIRAAAGQSSQLRGEMAAFVRKQESVDETSKRVKKVFSTTYTLVAFEEKVAACYSSIRYQILNDQIQEFTIRLPEDVTVHEIVGDDVEKWSARQPKDGMITYDIRVRYPVAERYDLSVRYEKSLSESQFSVPSLEVGNVARDVGYIGVEMQAMSEIFLKSLEKARLIDIRELPQIIRADAYAPFVYALRYVERPYRIIFDIRKHRHCEMDPALADRIQYTSVISPKGKVLSQAKMWIRNSRKQFASVKLPDSADLVSAFLDGKSIKPSVGENGKLLLPLKLQSAKPFVVDVIYEDAGVNLHSAGGNIRMTYPRVDLPASVVAADIYFPKEMNYTDPKGDFSKIREVRYLPWSGAGDDRTSTMNQEPSPQSQQMDMQQAPEQNRIAGTQSLKIDIPKKGRQMSLNTFYVPAGVSLSTDFYLIHRMLFGLGYAVMTLLIIGIGAGIPLIRRRPDNVRVPVIAGCGILLYLMPFALKIITILVLIGWILCAGIVMIRERKMRKDMATAFELYGNK